MDLLRHPSALWVLAEKVARLLDNTGEPAVNITLASCNQTALDICGNVERIIQALELSSEAGSQLLCLPELAVSGYGCEDAFYSIDLIREVERGVERLLPYTHRTGIFLGLPIYHKGHLYNAVMLAAGGRIAGINFKKILTNTGIHYESRWFTPWNMGENDALHYAGQDDVPCGDLFYNIDGVGWGVEICEESWSRHRSLAAVAHRCEVVFNASASHFSLGKYQIREQLVADSSRLLEAHFLYANLLGVDGGRIIYDGALMWAFGGKIQAQSPRMPLADLSLGHLKLDVSTAQTAKLRLQQDEGLGYQHPLSLPRCVDVTLQQPSVHRTSKPASSSLHQRSYSHRSIHFKQPQNTEKIPWARSLDERTQLRREEELFMALTLALFDYLRKSKAAGYVISVSGGCDSSTVLCLVSGMIRRGIRELGVVGFLAALHCSHLLDAAKKEERDLTAQTEEDIMWIIRQLLAAVYQPSRNSSAETQEAARELCYELGAFHCEYSIDAVVDQYLQGLTHGLQRPVSWQEDSVLLQNIQARARSPFPWLLANARRAILLSTGNRSEASLGYMTMDGDTAGGLAPLAGVGKDDLLKWLNWAHREGCGDLSCSGHIPALAKVLALRPTAELCPPHWQQSDEKDLMPYEVISHLEQRRIYDKKSSKEIHEELVRDFPSLSPELLKQYQQRFEYLWRTSQWKRERLALSFHVDDVNVDPKSACRFPVLTPTLAPPDYATQPHPEEATAPEVTSHQAQDSPPTSKDEYSEAAESHHTKPPSH